MKPTTYIDWDGLKDIPLFYCDTKEDEENKDFDIYYPGKLVLHDYNPVSYTHLDVYKRQAVFQSYIWTCAKYDFSPYEKRIIYRLIEFALLPYVDCSIRTSADQCLLATPRSFSQLATSFFGSQCQGIHLKLFVA